MNKLAGMNKSAGVNKLAGGELRIIAGCWRGRKLQFTAAPGLRPTPNRVRETLFNWLAPIISGAHCLDLFTGSGALGLEALSRGAADVTFVDQSSQVLNQIEAHLKLLQAQERAYLQQLTLPEQLQQLHCAKPFDVVFLDPPFHQGLMTPCCQALENSAYLSTETTIYIESEMPIMAPQLPQNWHIVRSKRAGQVAYQLVKNYA